MALKPLIGVTACVKEIGLHPYHVSGDKYLRAVSVAALGLPVIIPSLADLCEIKDLLHYVDGLLFTGSPSNVEPFHYQGPPSAPGTAHDPQRDATTLPLLRAAVAAGVPVLGICRGFQEVNVAFGGTLYQKVHEQPGFMDHRENKDDPLDVQYGPAHDIALVPGGVLAGLAGDTRATVNSLHGQGVRRLGEGLVVEAQAPDGLVEAFRHDGPAFMLAVQWHPEWKVRENAFYLATFRAFGDACRARAARRPA